MLRQDIHEGESDTDCVSTSKLKGKVSRIKSYLIALLADKCSDKKKRTVTSYV